MAGFSEPFATPGHYVTGLPKAMHNTPEWRVAATMLMQAAEYGAPVTLAAIAMLRGPECRWGPPEPPKPRRKPPKTHRVIR
jgi:hypothetical protein